jgi:hypothetical protein
MARRSQQRTRMHACVQAKGKSDQHLETGDSTMSPGSRCLRRAEAAQGPGNWLSGFEAGFRGNSYIYPADVPDRLAWSAGFIEGVAQRLQRLARIRIAPPSFTLPLWWRP